MKRSSVLLFFIPFFCHAQTSHDSTQPNTYLFGHFVDGAVLLKTGNIEQAALNYDTDKQSIIFRQNGQNLTLTGLENIDTIYIGDNKFVPVNDIFYRVGTLTPIALLISYSNKMHPLTATADHDGTSQQNNDHVNNTVSEAYLNRRFQPHYSVEFVRRYWLRRGHTLYKASNENQVIRVFPKKEEAIREFIKSNKTSFDNQEDIIRLIQFCND